jgi:hypothetical protein
MESPHLQSLVDRLQKLKTLMEQGGTEGESQAAACLLQTLLDKHGLDESVLESRKEDGGLVLKEFDFGTLRGNRAISWRKLLMGGLCKINDCVTISIKDTPKHIYMAGPDFQLVGILGLYEYLEATIIRLADTSWESFKPGSVGITKETYHSTFCEGGTNRILIRLERQKKKDVEEHDSLHDGTPGTDLILAKTKKVDEFVENIFNQVGEMKTRDLTTGRVDKGAFGEGYGSADKIALNRQVGGETKGKRLG